MRYEGKTIWKQQKCDKAVKHTRLSTRGGGRMKSMERYKKCARMHDLTGNKRARNHRTEKE
jgi:hypothetical protein